METIAPARREDSGRESGGPKLQSSTRFTSRSTLMPAGVLSLASVVIVKGTNAALTRTVLNTLAGVAFAKILTGSKEERVR
jgi:hypothetical protein